jgi:alpha-glucoside transport system substrate-binding protein
MNKRWLKLAAVPVALSFVAAACGSDDDSGSGDDTGSETTDGGGESSADFDGETVTITGPERDDPSIAAINDTLNAWGETVGLTIEYTGDADWEANINTQVEGGNPPDISFFPQPGKLADFARAGSVVALADDVSRHRPRVLVRDYQLYGNVDDVQYGVPVKTDLKSLVWYQPAPSRRPATRCPRPSTSSRRSPTDGDAAGGPPWCVGIESGQATGWTFTDWVEEMVLRQARRRRLRRWVSNEIPFDDPQIVEAMQTRSTLWTGEDERLRLADRDLAPSPPRHVPGQRPRPTR